MQRGSDWDEEWSVLSVFFSYDGRGHQLQYKSAEYSIRIVKFKRKKGKKWGKKQLRCEFSMIWQSLKGLFFFAPIYLNKLNTNIYIFFARLILKITFEFFYFPYRLRKIKYKKTNCESSPAPTCIARALPLPVHSYGFILAFWNWCIYWGG